jgi:hypothetical protein
MDDADVIIIAQLAPDTWALLHQLRLRGPHEVADGEHSTALVDAGLARRRGALLAPTPEGRAANAAWARLTPGSEEEAAARTAYERFLTLDRQLKSLVHSWQQVDRRSGCLDTAEWDHVDRLKSLDWRAGPVVRGLGLVVERFATYPGRLTAAVEQLEDGQRQWFCGMACDSYHMLWWQLHEDLLAGLGIPRSDDPNQ